ncbi:MAG: hypothetical protein EOO13_08860 [Chitinophagaceae bacterium]|nr:MAG: hypothetical protein EOO13_08860 [Chitinophagaceae bacterium]
MTKERSKRPRRTSAEIKSILEEFKQSNLSAKEFCKVHDIGEAGFYKWKSRYGDRESVQSGSFITFQQQSSLPAPGVKLFAEVKGIKLYQAVEASYLKELLA